MGTGGITRLFTGPSLQIPSKNMEICSLFTDTVITAKLAENISENDFQHYNKKACDLYQVVDADSSQQDAILL